MKQTLLFCFFSLILFPVLAQTKQWTWISGDNTTNQLGIYGTKGTPGATNKPGARNGAVQWRDASGNLWLMGGSGYASAGSGSLNDLWKYSPGTNQWTWISGDNIAGQVSIYGTMGTPDVNNKPGARNTSTAFTDVSGNLWLFGGFSSVYLSDLWKFNPSTTEWTWVSGAKETDPATNKRGVYGTKGTPAPGNKPGGRYSSASCLDANGDIWLFGGQGYATTVTDSYLNDLWKFTPSTGQWTWVSGDNIVGQTGIYGTKGTPGTGNKPGARYGTAMWTDASGSIWIFGGTGYALTTSFGELNDLWKFNPVTGEWTWVSGDNATNVASVYGTINVAAGTNKPGGRDGAAAWEDANGFIFIFGGIGYAPGFGDLNDLWIFNPTTAQWTWIGGLNGTSQKGTYGSKGTPAAANIPGARYNAAEWIDAASGKLWLFGGSGYGSGVTAGSLNDLWTYLAPNTALPVVFTNFTAKKQSGKVLLEWSTASEQNSRYFIIERSSDGVSFKNIGQVAAAGNSSLVINYSFADAVPAQGTNIYRLKQVDFDGRFLYSKTVSISINENAVDIALIQNPVQNTLQLKVYAVTARQLNLVIKDAQGSLLMNKTAQFVKGNSLYSLPVGHLAKGVYYLTVSAPAGQKISTKVFIKQ